jgi:hypothetical protein
MIKQAVKAGLCTLAAGGVLLAVAPAAQADSWHRLSTHDTYAGCMTWLVLNGYGGTPADRVKCELDGTWHPFQTYGSYVRY